MWQIVYVVHTREEAERIKEELTAEGFLIKIEGMGEGDYQIKTPRSEAEEVYEILNQRFNV